MAQRGLLAVMIVLVVAFMLTSLSLAYVALNGSSESVIDQAEDLYVPIISYAQPTISAENDPYKTEIVQLGSSRHRSDSDDDDDDDDSEPRFDFTSNLGLHLKFDDSVGSTSFTDSSSGASASCSASTCPTLGANGRDGTSALFQGSDLVTVSNRPSIHSNTSLTIASWVYVENFSRPWATIISKINGPIDCQSQDDCSNREYGLWINREGFIEFDITTANNINRAKSSCYTDENIVQAGQWAHIVAVADGPNQVMRVYVNGNLKAECSEPSLRYGIRDSDGAVSVGRMINVEWDSGSNVPLSGMIDDLRYYQNRALTSSEVRELHRL